MATRFQEYHFECPFCRTRREGELEDLDIATLAAYDFVGRCYCVRLDRFGYVTGYTFGSTICWVKDVHYHLDKDGPNSDCRLFFWPIWCLHEIRSAGVGRVFDLADRVDYPSHRRSVLFQNI